MSVVKNALCAVGFLVGSSGAVMAADAVDAGAAEALAKKSGCLMCHSVAVKKVGPAFKDVAAKYKGNPDAEKALYQHLTTHPKVKMGGAEQAHDSLKTKNDADIYNVIRWMLTLGT